MHDKNLFQILYRPIFVPVVAGEGGEISPAVMNIQDHDLVLGFSSALALAQLCGEGTDFIEVPASELFANLQAASLDFGFDFGQEDAALYASSQLGELLELGGEDALIDMPPNPEFVSHEFSNALILALRDLACEPPQVEDLFVGYERQIGMVICVSQKSLDKNIALLARLRDIAIEHGEGDAANILALNQLDALGQSFIDHAVLIEPTPASKVLKVPILR